MFLFRSFIRENLYSVDGKWAGLTGASVAELEAAGFTENRLQKKRPMPWIQMSILLVCSRHIAFFDGQVAAPGQASPAKLEAPRLP